MVVYNSRGGENMTGYDPSVVNESINGVAAAYTSLYDAINTKMQTAFFQGMADKWACTQAQKFFQSVKEVMDQIINKSNTIFQSVVDSMNSAGNAWAQQTESEYTPVSIETQASTLDAGCIQENINGVRGIDVHSASSTANSALNASSEAAISALNSAVSAVASSGFVGGQQQANLTESLNTIKSNINSALSDIVGELNNAVSETVAQYGDTEGRVSQAFAGSGN